MVGLDSLLLKINQQNLPRNETDIGQRTKKRNFRKRFCDIAISKASNIAQNLRRRLADDRATVSVPSSQRSWSGSLSGSTNVVLLAGRKSRKFSSVVLLYAIILRHLTFWAKGA